MGRPRKKIDPEQVKQLARIGCSGEEIAAVVGCSRDLIYKRFSTAIKDGHEHMKASVRRQQYAVAMKGNPTMLIWLGKQHLGQRDKQEHTGPDGGPIQVVDQARQKLLDKLSGAISVPAPTGESPEDRPVN